jgi:hypothetical protein
VLGTDGILVLPTTADTAPLIGESGEKLERFRNRSIQMLGPVGSDAGMIWLAQWIAGHR